MIGVTTSRHFDRRVQNSWERCKSEYALNAEQRRSPNFVTLGDLDRRRKLAGTTYAIACAELASLGPILRGPIGVTFTDREAVILGYAGDRSFAHAARQFGLRPGAVWSESEQGTNGMGTCLAERAPVVIERRQHFLRQNTALTCCAVPILDGTGRLVGALNVSTLGSLSSAPTMALLELVARNVENRTLLESYRRKHFVLRFHEARELVSTMAEGLLVIDKSGTVVASNQAALAMLSSDAHVAVCGRSATDVLGLDVPQLKCLFRQSPHYPQLVRNGPYFALVQEPIEQESSALENAERIRIAGNALETAERQALLTVLGRNKWNVSRAAAGLHLSRRTLHRKLRRFGLRRDDLT